MSKRRGGLRVTETNPNMIIPDIAELIDQSVLCWLGTTSEDGFPNVSPKEAFLHDGEGRILVGNIASPVTVRNIERDERVCISFVNIFIQKGYKIRGTATVVKSGDPGYGEQHGKLTEMIGSTFPIVSVIEIKPVAVDEIVAPSYRLFPESGPVDRVRESLETYRVEQYQKWAEEGGAGVKE